MKHGAISIDWTPEEYRRLRAILEQTRKKQEKVKTVLVAIRLTPDFKAQLETIAEKEGITVSDVHRMALYKFVYGRDEI